MKRKYTTTKHTEVKMSKQTALKWFKDVTYPYLDKESKEYVDILFNHALQMEREQIVKAWNSCGESIMTEEFDNAEQYYEQTYRV
jgi:hypothetical protein